ncbi:MAG TPA: hypothetical protein VIQ31_25215 [Phormidium sp.]|jgi:hypothetical protein
MAALSTYAIATTKLYARPDELSNSDGASSIGLIKEPTDEAFNQAVAEIEAEKLRKTNGKLENNPTTH